MLGAKSWDRKTIISRTVALVVLSPFLTQWRLWRLWRLGTAPRAQRTAMQLPRHFVRTCVNEASKIVVQFRSGLSAIN